LSGDNNGPTRHSINDNNNDEQVNDDDNGNNYGFEYAIGVAKHDDNFVYKSGHGTKCFYRVNNTNLLT
jgi:hypothetical protein